MNPLILKAIGEAAQASALLDQFKAELVKQTIDKKALHDTLEAAALKIMSELRLTVAEYIG